MREEEEKEVTTKNSQLRKEVQMRVGPRDRETEGTTVALATASGHTGQ